MKEIEMVFASRNSHKMKEMQYLLNYDADSSGSENEFKIKLLSLEDIGFKGEIEENGETFFDNARIKAVEVRNVTGRLCLSDDSGLCVNYLNDAPGIYSARYSGENATDDENIDKLLKELKGLPREKRKARFVCVLCVALPGDNHFYTMGECEGYILKERTGTMGFGYDPIFFLADLYKSLGEVSVNEKNSYSHRYHAAKKLRAKLSYYVNALQG